MVEGETSDSGFTVLEVLVALTVLAMSMAVLLAVFSQGLDRVHASEVRIQARNLAQSLLMRAEQTPPKALKDADGESGGLSWQLRLSPFGASDDRDAWEYSPMRLTATVRWTDHGATRSLSLSTLRLTPRQAES